MRRSALLSHLGYVRMAVAGSMTTGSAGLRSVSTSALASGARTVHLDLGGVDAIDFAGLAELIALSRRLRARGGRLRLTAVSAPCETELSRVQVLLDARH